MMPSATPYVLPAAPIVLVGRGTYRRSSTPTNDLVMSAGSRGRRRARRGADERPRTQSSCLNVDRQSEHAEHQQRDGPWGNGEVGEAEAATDEGARTHEARDADARGEELEDDQQQADHEQEISD